MSGTKRTSTSGRTLFTLVLAPGAASPRKKRAPAARAHADKRRKAPRFRQDYSAETAE